MSFKVHSRAITCTLLAFGVSSMLMLPHIVEAKKPLEKKQGSSTMTISKAEACISSESNPNNRAAILRDLKKQYHVGKLSASELYEMDHLIMQCLNDRYPRVCIAAANLAAHFKIQTTTPTLVDAYTDARKNYRAYCTRVRLSIIGALGTIGGSEAENQLRKILKEEPDILLVNKTLLTIEANGMTSLLNSVQKYIAQTEPLIAAKDLSKQEEPFIEYLTENVKLAKNIAKSLSVKAGL